MGVRVGRRTDVDGILLFHEFQAARWAIPLENIKGGRYLCLGSGDDAIVEIPAVEGSIGDRAGNFLRDGMQGQCEEGPEGISLLDAREAEDETV